MANAYRLADLGLMTLRIYAMIECPVRNTFCGKQVRKIKRHDGVLSVRSVKLFAGKHDNPNPNHYLC